MALIMDHINHNLLQNGAHYAALAHLGAEIQPDHDANEAPAASRQKRKRAELRSGHSDDSGDLEDDMQGKRRPQEDAKRKHNITSQKGRAKINSEIDSLKELMPECRGSEFNKARVLHYAVERMRLLLAQMDVLTKENARLQRQNEQLWEEMRFIKAASGQAGVAQAAASLPFNLGLMNGAAPAAAQVALSPQQQAQLAALAPFLLAPNLANFNAALTGAVPPQPKQEAPAPPQSDQHKPAGSATLDPATAALLFGAASPQTPNLAAQAVAAQTTPLHQFYGVGLPQTPLGLPAGLNLAALPHLGLNMNDLMGMIAAGTPGAAQTPAATSQTPVSTGH